MPETVLIVDDHDGFRQLARRLLDRMGYQVIGECANGREGVQETARLSPDIVLLDVQLPDIDGIEVAASLNASNNPPHIVLVSNRDAADYGPRLARAGAHGFITKSRSLRRKSSSPARVMSKAMRFAGQGVVLVLALLAWFGGLGGPVRITPFMLAGAAFVIAGLAAWSLRPRNRLGPLMAIAGLGLLLEADQSLVPEWSGILLQIIFFPVLVIPIHVLLAFPDGVIRTPRQRGFVRSVYVITTLGAASALAVFARTNSPVLASVINGVTQAGYLVSLTIASVLTFRRWTKGSSAVRRGLSPVVWSLLPALAALWAAPVGSLIGPQLDLAFGPPISYLEAGLQVLLTALPAGVLIGLLRAELDMSSVGELVIKLSDGLLPEQVEPALAGVLHDPSLKVVYWLPTLSRFGDREGNPLDLARASRRTRSACSAIRQIRSRRSCTTGPSATRHVVGPNPPPQPPTPGQPYPSSPDVFGLVGGGAAWATGYRAPKQAPSPNNPPSPGASGPDRVLRMDLRDGSVSTWYKVSEPDLISLVGLDGQGRPILGFVQLDRKAEPQPGVYVPPVARLVLLTGPNQTLEISAGNPDFHFGGMPLADSHGIWFGSWNSVWLYTVTGGLRQVANIPAGLFPSPSPPPGLPPKGGVPYSSPPGVPSYMQGTLMTPAGPCA